MTRPTRNLPSATPSPIGGGVAFSADNPGVVGSFGSYPTVDSLTMPKISSSGAEGSALPKHTNDGYLVDTSGARHYLTGHVDITVSDLCFHPAASRPEADPPRRRGVEARAAAPLNPHNPAMHCDHAATA